MVYCAGFGKCPELGRSYPLFTIMIDMSFGIAQHGVQTVIARFCCIWCPNLFPCLILHSVLSQSIEWGLIRIGIGYCSFA